MTETRKQFVFERVYRAPAEVLWELWTTKEGFESWWGPVGFRVEVHAIDAREGGELRYDMIADTDEMVAALAAMGRPPSHPTRATFSDVRPNEHLTMTNVIDFVPGVATFESTITVDLVPSHGRVRMVVTADAMHDAELTRLSVMGFESQLTKLDDRFGARIVPCLWYAADAEEAARLYTSIFPDSHIDRVSTLQSDSPSGPPGSVRLVELTLLGQRFQAMSAGPHHEFNDAISFMVKCETQEELDGYWSALLRDGGKEQACGWLIDRFGVRWQIVPAALDRMMRDRDPVRAKRVTDALLKMVKLDLAALEAAFEG